MWEEILKAIPVFLSSMIKFILGPTGGYTLGLHPVSTVLATVAGSMCSVVAFTFFGDWLRLKVLHRFGKKKVFSANNRRFVSLWKKYGIVGVAALMPLILTPIGGTALAVGFGSPPKKILTYMLISSTVWAIIFTTAIYAFGKAVLPEIIKP